MSPPSRPKRGLATMIPGSSKRPCLSPHGARPWASLPEDLLRLIGWRVLAGDLLDYVRFRAVCTHWHSSAVRPHGCGILDPRFHPRRWMLLPEGHGLYPGHPNLGGYVRFFNLSTGAFVRVHLPLFDDHIVLDSVDGLLLLLRHPDTAIRLLHPFTGEIAELPLLSSLVPQMDSKALRRITEDKKLRKLGIFLSGLCATVTVSVAGVITVMLTLDMIQVHRVAYAAAGDQRWALSDWKLPLLLTSTVSFQGKLYALSLKSESYQNDDDDKVYIYRVNPPQSKAKGSHTLSPPAMIAECPLLEAIGAVHLVECDSELMLVGYNDTSYTHLVVHRLDDLIRGRVVPVTDFGEHALFLDERGLCVSKNKGFPSVPSNSIIFINRWSVYNRQGQTPELQQWYPGVDQYHLGSGTWSPAIDEDLLCWDRRPPASPYILLHHIFTCCIRSYWNKGLMFCSASQPIWSLKPNLWIEG